MEGDERKEWNGMEKKGKIGRNGIPVQKIFLGFARDDKMMYLPIAVKIDIAVQKIFLHKLRGIFPQ
jgi:hypothetical protein